MEEFELFPELKKKREINKNYDLRTLAVGSKPTISGEHPCVCPLCKERKEAETPGREYTKRKLYIDKEYQVGYCQVCTTIFYDKNYLNKIKGPEEWKPFVIGSYHLLNVPYNGKDKKDPATEEYLLKRCPPLYSKVDFSSLGFYGSDKKVVIKFMLNGKNYFYQLRYLDPDKDNNGNRYYSPMSVEGWKPLYFAGGSYNPYKPTILVEGVFTALAERLVVGQDYNVVAVLGHYMTDYQLDMLKSLGCFGKIYIHMDEINMSYEMKKSLWERKFRSTKVIRNWSEKLDSEEIIRNKKLTVEQYRDFLYEQMDRDTSFVLSAKSKFDIPICRLS